jgi:hypothetical protein
MNRSKKIVLLILLVIVLVIAVAIPVVNFYNSKTSNHSGTPQTTTPDGYAQIVSLSGAASTESQPFTVTSADNRFVIKTTENNKDGLKGQIVKVDDTGVETAWSTSFTVTSQPNDETWPFNLAPGKYKIKVESTGTKFEIRMEEKVNK